MQSKRSVWLAEGGLIILAVVAMITGYEDIAKMTAGGVITGLGFLIGAR